MIADIIGGWEDDRPRAFPIPVLAPILVIDGIPLIILILVISRDSHLDHFMDGIFSLQSMTHHETQRPSLVCNSYSSMISDVPFAGWPTRVKKWLVASSPLCLLVDLLICHDMFQKPDHIGPATFIHIYSFKLLQPYLILLKWSLWNRLIDYPL